MTRAEVVLELGDPTNRFDLASKSNPIRPHRNPPAVTRLHTPPRHASFRRSVATYRRRTMRGTHQPPYTPTQTYRLQQKNKFVQVYLVAGLLATFLVAVLFNLLGHAISLRRRKVATRFIGKVRPSGACSRTGKGCTRWVPGTIVAMVRKMGGRRSRVAESLGMGSLAELAVIGAYYFLHLVLVVTSGERKVKVSRNLADDPECSAEGNVDYMAHHCARLVFANLPLGESLAIGVLYANLTSLQSSASHPRTTSSRTRPDSRVRPSSGLRKIMLTRRWADQTRVSTSSTGGSRA